MQLKRYRHSEKEFPAQALCQGFSQLLILYQPIQNGNEASNLYFHYSMNYFKALLVVVFYSEHVKRG